MDELADAIGGDESVANAPPIVTVCSKAGAVCPLCENAVEIGDHILPIGKKCAPASLLWAHDECTTNSAILAKNDEEWLCPPVCRHWRRGGKCPYLEKARCAFGHPEDEKGKGELDDGKRSWGGKRRRLRNKQSAGVFRVWLLNTFGEEYLKSGTGVLDVAGGKGELSFELFNLNAVRCTVIDPRPLLLSRVEKKWRKGQYGERRTGPLFAKWNPCYNQGKSPSPPPHLRIFFHAEEAVHQAEEAGKASEAGEAWIMKARRAGRKVAWTTKGLEEDDDDAHEEDGEEAEELEAEPVEERGETEGSADEPPQEISDTRPEEVTTFNEASELLNGASLVAGLHPDQAAGEIVDFALARRIPFAVVPCCVYKKEFPKRHLPDGNSVSSYDDLLAWLQSRHPCIRQSKLDFEGKNVVLYMLQEDF